MVKFYKLKGLVKLVIEDIQKATEKEVGLLINFGRKKVEFKRFIY